MTELLTLTPRGEALSRLLKALPEENLNPENVPLDKSLGRVLAEDVQAAHPLPHFARSTVDGYAVRAGDTVGASESLPAYLEVTGEVVMGEPTTIIVQAGQAAIIHTGGMIPQGADAVVMVERTQEAVTHTQGSTTPTPWIEVLKPVAPGENVIPIGEDVKTGAVIMPAGHILRAQELGGLAALGVTQVKVTQKPKVAIISTGDELVPPEQTPRPNQVRDINSLTIGALVEQNGALAQAYGIVRDDPEKLYKIARKALQETDMVIITAGSSVSVRDMTSTVINRLGEPGVLVHGVPVKPGKPIILGVCNNKPVFGLPGNPVSALNTTRLFVIPTLWYLQGTAPPRPGFVRARLGANIPAPSGRETFVAVRLEEHEGELWAYPNFGESNLIFTLVRGEGVVRLPIGATGLSQDTQVEVELLR
ncbi:MAG: molybdopterin molybdotransferase MoeA [Anaerolineae bacterium]|nr:molybdopterin molybdotransferase MoeA [Anaerolineae bacterium]